MIVTPRHNDWNQAIWISAHYVCILSLIRYHCFNDFASATPLKTGHLCITYVGGNNVVDVPTIPDLHLLGESCIFKHRIPGECSSVVSTIHLGTPKFDMFPEHLKQTTSGMYKRWVSVGSTTVRRWQCSMHHNNLKLLKS